MASIVWNLQNFGLITHLSPKIHGYFIIFQHTYAFSKLQALHSFDMS